MKYYWLRDRKDKHHYYFGEYDDTHEADYFTKYHSVNYHQDMCTRYINDNLTCEGVLVQRIPDN